MAQVESEPKPARKESAPEETANMLDGLKEELGLA